MDEKDNVNGIVQIADEVIAIIASTATLEIEGVSEMAGNMAGGLIEKLSKKNSAKGITIDKKDGTISADVSIMVFHDYKIQDVAFNVQKKVKGAIETMTGIETTEVNVNVVGIEFDKNKTSNGVNEENS